MGSTNDTEFLARNGVVSEDSIGNVFICLIVLDSDIFDISVISSCSVVIIVYDGVVIWDGS